MSTANVARDLDVLRAAVGDRRLSYAGVSYGSYLGVTYANLFPGRVRALGVDGVLDPIAWSTGRGGEAGRLPFSTRLRSDAGAQATLNEFFRLCDAGGDACAFSGDAADRFAALAQRLREEPVEITFPDGTTGLLDYSNLISFTLGALYDSLVVDRLRARCSPTSKPRSHPRGWAPGSAFLPARPAGLQPDARHARAHHDGLRELRRGLPRRRLLGQRQPGRLRRLVDRRGAVGRPVWLLRAYLDLGPPALCAEWRGFDRDR